MHEVPCRYGAPSHAKLRMPVVPHMHTATRCNEAHPCGAAAIEPPYAASCPPSTRRACRRLWPINDHFGSNPRTKAKCACKAVGDTELPQRLPQRLGHSGSITHSARLTRTPSAPLHREVVACNVRRRCVTTHLLKHLELLRCSMITDLGMSSVVATLQLLRHLNIWMCSNVTDVGVQSITTMQRRLQHLNLFACQRITDVKLTACSTCGCSDAAI